MMYSSTDLDSISGGLVYHYRAHRYQKTLWSPFRKNLAAWLNTWLQKNSHLLLIGASAGYSLPVEFLSRYNSITVNEIDPLAKIIFKRRFPSLNVTWIKEDLLGKLIRIENHLKSNTPCDVLFCNILGQIAIAFQDNPHGFILWSTQLKEILRRHHYASYHDLFSFSGNYSWKTSRVVCDGAIEEQALLNEFLNVGQPTEVELIDHWMQNLLSLGPREILHWELKPNKHHLIECVHGCDV